MSEVGSPKSGFPSTESINILTKHPNLGLQTSDFGLKRKFKMKKITLVIILIALATLALKSNANTIIDGAKTNPIDSAKKVIIDPVCKMKIKANTSKTTVYNKITYNFCSESCKQKFLAEPANYVKK